MAEALKEIITKGKYYKIAQEKGIASTTFSKQEMVQINRLYQIVKSQKSKKLVRYCSWQKIWIMDFKFCRRFLWFYRDIWQNHKNY